MRYELLSVTPNMEVDEECFIVRVKKIPSMLESKLGHRTEIMIFIRKRITKKLEEGINFVDWKWFYYDPVENIEDQLVKSKKLDLWLNNTVKEWLMLNDSPSNWRFLEENEKEIREELDRLKNLKDEDIYREELNVLIEEMGFSEEQAREELREEIKENKEKIKGMIEDLEEELDCYEDENYEYDDNSDFQKNGTYNYMNIKVFRKKYNITGNSIELSGNKHHIIVNSAELSLGDKIGSIIIGGFVGGILTAVIRDLIKNDNIRDASTEAIGVLLGAMIIGPIIMRYLNRNR